MICPQSPRINEGVSCRRYTKRLFVENLHRCQHDCDVFNSGQSDKDKQIFRCWIAHREATA